MATMSYTKLRAIAGIRKLNDIGTNADPNCNVLLPPEVQEHIAGLPDVVALRTEQDRLSEILR